MMETVPRRKVFGERNHAELLIFDHIGKGSRRNPLVFCHTFDITGPGAIIAPASTRGIFRAGLLESRVSTIVR